MQHKTVILITLSLFDGWWRMVDGRWLMADGRKYKDLLVAIYRSAAIGSIQMRHRPTAIGHQASNHWRRIFQLNGNGAGGGEIKNGAIKVYTFWPPNYNLSAMQNVIPFQCKPVLHSIYIVWGTFLHSFRPDGQQNK